MAIEVKKKYKKKEMYPHRWVCFVSESRDEKIVELNIKSEIKKRKLP